MDGKLVSLKIAKGDRDAKDAAPSSLMTDGPAYPWGLSITLDQDVLDKLDMSIDNFKVGATMALIAKVEVTACSSEERQGSDARQSVGLQITHVCIEEGAGKATSAAKAGAALYGKDS